MMVEPVGWQDRLSYEFDLEDMVPGDHLPCRIYAVLDLRGRACGTLSTAASASSISWAGKPDLERHRQQRPEHRRQRTRALSRPRFFLSQGALSTRAKEQTHDPQSTLRHSF